MQRQTEEGLLQKILVNNPGLFLGILSFCDYKTLLNLMLSAKFFIPFCTNDTLWQAELDKKFPAKESAYYPLRRNAVGITALGLFKNHLTYATYDFINLFFNDHYKKFTIYVNIPDWRLKGEELELRGMNINHFATDKDNIHPLFKKALNCKSYAECLTVLREINNNAGCQIFILNFSVTLPLSYNSIKGRSFHACETISDMIDYLSDRVMKKPLVSNRNKRGRCALS